MNKTKKDKAVEMSEKVNKELSFGVQDYIKNMTTNMPRNAKMLKDYSMDWKKYAYRINSLQKLLFVSPFEFERQLMTELSKLKSK